MSSDSARVARVLRGAGDRDRVQRDREPAGEERLVVRGGGPREHLVRHPVPVDVAHDLEGLDRAFAIRPLADDDAVLLVLDEAAVAVEERREQHVGVDLVRHAEPDGVSELLQLGRALPQVVPRPEAHARLLQEAATVLDGVGRIRLGEAVELLRPRVVGRLPRDPRHLPDLLRHLLDEIGDRDRLLLERRRR